MTGSKQVRRWRIARFEGWSDPHTGWPVVSVTGPDTSPPDGSGLAGEEWVDAGVVEVMSLSDLQREIAAVEDELFGLDASPFTALRMVRARLGIDVERKD